MKMKTVKKLLFLVYFLLCLFQLVACDSFQLPTYTIEASAGIGGSIDPAGKVEVLFGFDQSFTITPDPGYQIENILVDGYPAKIMNPYVFTDVTQDHTIAVTFSGSSVPGSVHNLTQGIYYNTIQTALDDTNNNDNIEVYAGIYDESISFPANKKIILQSVNGASSTTIRGIADFPTVSVEDSLAGTTLNGFTITHQSGDSGSGIKINTGYMNMADCIISGNTSDNYGGGIYSDESSSVTITESTVSGNTATYDGGGIFNGTGSSLTIIDSAIFDNSADRYGGGIHNFSSTLVMTGSNIYHNSALSNGGGIMIWATGMDSLSIGGVISDDKNFICGNYKSGNNPSLGQQIRSYFAESLYDYFCDTNYISINCGLLPQAG